MKGLTEFGVVALVLHSTGFTHWPPFMHGKGVSFFVRVENGTVNINYWGCVFCVHICNIDLDGADESNHAVQK
jgi:hypothetical protein